MNQSVLHNTAGEILDLAKREYELAIPHLNAAMNARTQAKTFWTAATQIPACPERTALCKKAQDLEEICRLQWNLYEAKEKASKALRKSARIFFKKARQERNAQFWGALTRRFKAPQQTT